MRWSADDMAAREGLPDESWEKDETLLWQAFQRGEPAAFDFLYQAHIDHLIAYGFKIADDRNLIQDCIQDLFVELWERRRTLAQARSVKSYLLKSLRYKIVRNLQKYPTSALAEDQHPATHDNAEVRWLRHETATLNAKQLEAALARLPKRQREAIYLRYFHELSNEEVAGVMGVNYQSACKFIYTALKTLRSTLQLLACAGISLLPF